MCCEKYLKDNKPRPSSPFGAKICSDICPCTCIPQSTCVVHVFLKALKACFLEQIMSADKYSSLFPGIISFRSLELHHQPHKSFQDRHFTLFKISTNEMLPHFEFQIDIIHSIFSWTFLFVHGRSN